MFNKKNTAQPQANTRTADAKAASPLFEKTQSRPMPLSGPAPAEIQKPAEIKPDGLITPHTQPKDLPMNQKPPAAPAPAFRPDLSRLDTPRAADMARPDLSRFDSPRRADAPQASPVHKPEPVAEMRKLIVGRDIALAGEISACDYLVVEGTVEARVREGRHIEIADSGLFRGTVEIDEADIAGRFEGDITVRGRLRVRSTGRIDGKIQYGELEVEAGGHLEGEVRGLKSKQAQADKTVGQKARVITPSEAEEAPQPAIAKA